MYRWIDLYRILEIQNQCVMLAFWMCSCNACDQILQTESKMYASTNDPSTKPIGVHFHHWTNMFLTILLFLIYHCLKNTEFGRSKQSLMLNCTSRLHEKPPRWIIIYCHYKLIKFWMETCYFFPTFKRW